MAIVGYRNSISLPPQHWHTWCLENLHESHRLLFFASWQCWEQKKSVSRSQQSPRWYHFSTRNIMLPKFFLPQHKKNSICIAYQTKSSCISLAQAKLVISAPITLNDSIIQPSLLVHAEVYRIEWLIGHNGTDPLKVMQKEQVRCSIMLPLAVKMVVPNWQMSYHWKYSLRKPNFQYTYFWLAE